MERERGVSITSSVMQLSYANLRINLLDTPGHKDFSEDTYRTLMAVDSAAMLIDAAKGVEAQTRKLYEVCRLRRIPIFTFANKMDREGRDPLALIDDVEQTLQMKCYPVTWPIGMGDRFAGLYHRLKHQLLLFRKGDETPEVVPVRDYTDPLIEARVGSSLYSDFRDSLELLEMAIGPFDKAEFLQGLLSPMTFGSAKNNWGINLFLDLFSQHAPAPGTRSSNRGEISPTESDFSGFVFKIQANMDRKHRDRVAFVRVVSGRFERGMKVFHPRLKKEIRLAYANQFLAQSRETVDEAFPGDIVGINDSGNLQIGDSLTSKLDLEFEPMPRFSPELFGRLAIKDPLKRKQLQKAISQLAQEGTIQIFLDPQVGMQDPILGVVGELQFDVLLFRLNEEYDLQAKLERLPYTVARWAYDENQKPTRDIKGASRVYEDIQGNPVVLLERDWDLKWLEKENSNITFRSTLWRAVETSETTA